MKWDIYIYKELIITKNILGINFTELCEKQTKELKKGIDEKYITTNAKDMFKWQNIKNYFAIQNGIAWKWISEFIGDKENIIFFNESDEKIAFLFYSSYDLINILSETSGFEFYVTDRSLSYLICCNHHDYLIVAGKAKKWLMNRTN
ncbi:hypothetical protein AN639_09475 [Candidatus Epulonipiscium fishelsonii]|uniref:Uncharacterized protein n=1 Tax=Candidatus Epulonipiscium fishelsonii TaxID=77094 RepID=A0ACC8XEJ4_9FIRM|nr:hypothetical protein AN639_09475 [Epulopiscium sp. SCG-B05WGA-EpuloA1]ONI41415.1 hypothetical protein AN396_03595 [Epulopiscium sp. SCG-B11WGA-EpuloA1]